MEVSLITILLRHRKLDRSAVVYGVIAAGLLIGAIFQWIRLGKILVIDEFCRQMGLSSLLVTFQIIVVSILGLVLIRGVLAVLRTRLEPAGELHFHHDGLEIKKGKLAFNLSGASLQQFKIKIPKSIADHEGKLRGGCFLHVPTPEGVYQCEFELADQAAHDRLTQILEHMRHVHQVAVDLEYIGQ